MRTLMIALTLLVIAASIQFADSKSSDQDADYLEDSPCEDYDWQCAAVDGAEFGMTALKIILALVTISCIVTWLCMFGIVIWLFVKKSN